jgi:peroxiredoxin
LSERYNDFKKAGAQIIAINAEASTEQRDFRKTKNIEYLFLSDPEAAAVKKYGIFSDTDPTHIVPSTFIIDRGGVIRWKYIGKDAHDRPQPDVVLEALKKIR